MAKERIEVEGGKTYGPYSPGVKANGVVWLAGQIAPEVGDDVSSQTSACLDKIDALLAAAGVSKNDACFVQVLLDDINDFAAMNEVYSVWVGEMDIPPARAAFEVAALPCEAKVEIVVQAIDENCC
jgi:2-iminobutanoate/2-iminopropanoate deaminase